MGVLKYSLRLQLFAPSCFLRVCRALSKYSQFQNSRPNLCVQKTKPEIYKDTFLLGVLKYSLQLQIFALSLRGHSLLLQYCFKPLGNLLGGSFVPVLINPNKYPLETAFPSLDIIVPKIETQVRLLSNFVLFIWLFLALAADRPRGVQCHKKF